MKKLVAGILCALCAFASFAADLSGRVDESAKAVVLLKLQSILANPTVEQEIRKNLKEQLEQSAFNDPTKKFSDYFGDVLAFGDPEAKQVAVYLETRNVTPEQLDKEFASMDNVKKEKLGKLDVYVLDPGTPEAGVEPTLAAIPEKDLLLIGTKQLFTKLLTGKSAPNAKLTDMLNATDKNALLRMALLVPPTTEQEATQMPRLESLLLDATLRGADMSAFLLNAKATAVNPQEAAKAQMLVQQAILMGSMLMAEQPELFQQMAQAIKVDCKDKVVTLKIDVNEELGRKIVALVREVQAKQAAQEAAKTDDDPTVTK